MMISLLPFLFITVVASFDVKRTGQQYHHSTKTILQATSSAARTDNDDAVIIPTTTWFIDGNNLMAARGIPKNLDAVQERLGSMRTRQVAAFVQVMLVMDGPKIKGANDDDRIEATQRLTDKNSNGNGANNEQSRDTRGCCTRICLAAGQSADDYIFESVAAMSSADDAVLHVVTADAELRRRVRSIKPSCIKNVVNPVRFWKTYLPRLAGEKD